MFEIDSLYLVEYTMFGCAMPDHQKGSRWKPVASLFSYCNNEGAWTKGFDRGNGWDRMEG